MCGVFPRWVIKISQCDTASLSLRRDGFHHRIQQPHCDRHIARMGGYAGFTYAYHRVLTAKAFKRRAAAPGQALIAGLIGVVK